MSYRGIVANPTDGIMLLLQLQNNDFSFHLKYVHGYFKHANKPVFVINNVSKMKLLLCYISSIEFATIPPTHNLYK